MSYTAPAIGSALKYSTGEIKKPDDVFNYKYQNIVISLMSVMEEKDEVYNKSLNEIERVIKLIDEELDTK